MFATAKETLFSLSVFLFCAPACGDSDANTTAVITTIITGVSATDAVDTTTDVPDTSTSTEPTTGGDDTSTSTTLDTSTTTTGEPSRGCFNEGTECPTAPAESTFCEYVAAACASHGVEPFYCEIVKSKCAASRGVDECQVCFSLENYCAQIGSDCDGLMTECLCAHAALEGGV